MINNLLNVKNTDFSYRLVEESLSREILSRASEIEAAVFNSLPQLSIIAADDYFLHYSMFPRIRSEENPDSLLEQARKGMEEYAKEDEFRVVHSLTQLDDELSRIYAVKLTQEILKALAEELKKRAKEDEQLRAALSECEKCRAPGAFRKIAEAAKSAFSKEILAEAREKAKRTTEMAAELRNLVGGKFASKEAGTYELVEKIEALEVKNADKIISFANRVYNSVKFAEIKKIIDKLGDEVAGYRRTFAIERALPRELAMPEEIFFAKLASGGFASREKRRVVEGALYVLIDKSGSMFGEKTIWARSVALALWKLAKMRRRKYFLRFFDDVVYERIEEPMKALEHILHIESNGGTNIDRALAIALDDISHLRNLTNTIVIITDGEDYVRIPADEFKRRSARLLAVMIQGDNRELEELALATRGDYLRAKLDERGALELAKRI